MSNHPASMEQGYLAANEVIPQPPLQIPEQNITSNQNYLNMLKSLIVALANDYLVFGHTYNSIPMHIRFDPIASKGRVSTQASYDFVVAESRKVSEMIGILRTLRREADSIEDTLTGPSKDIDFGEVRGKFQVLETHIAYGMVLIAKLHAIVTLYVDVVIAGVKATGGSLAESEKNRDRSYKIMRRWFDALPAVCFEGFPGLPVRYWGSRSYAGGVQ